MANTQTAQTIPPQNIPEPSGFDENGNPYWLDANGNRISWQQMQQVLWQQWQAANASTQRSSNPEAMPQMPQLPSMPNYEAQPEKLVHNPESESGLEATAEQQKPQTQQSTQAADEDKQGQTASREVDLFEDTVKLPEDLSDPVKALDFAEAHKKKSDPKSSNSFLGHLLYKVLASLVGK